MIAFDGWGHKMNMFVSSANNLGTAFLNAFGMSLTNITYKRGPTTDPSGTPHSTVFEDGWFWDITNGFGVERLFWGRTA